MRLILTLSLISMIISCTEKASDNHIYAQTGSFQLADPIIDIDSIFFKKSATVSMNLGLEDIEIRHTLNRYEPTENDNIIQNPLVLDASFYLHVKAFHPDFIPSSKKEIVGIKVNNKLDSSRLFLYQELNESYPGNGVKSLTDLKKGMLSFQSNSDWLGFQEDSIRIVLELKEERELQLVKLSLLSDPKSWIFTPVSIKIKRKGKELGSIEIPQIEEAAYSKFVFLDIPIVQTVYKHFEITIYSMKNIPEWHPGAGEKPWLFIDEIMVD